MVQTSLRRPATERSSEVLTQRATRAPQAKRPPHKRATKALGVRGLVDPFESPNLVEGFDGPEDGECAAEHHFAGDEWGR